MQIDIQPLEEQVDHWIKSYVPEKDFFFLQSRDISHLNLDLNQVLVIPEDEFFGHVSYKQIQLVNSYEFWKRSNEVAYVIVAHPDWVTQLPIETKKELFENQVKLGRGLILPYAIFPTGNEIPIEHILRENEEKHVVLHYAMWQRLSNKTKAHVLREYAKEWDKWFCYEPPKQIPSHLKIYANTFPSHGGSNCLSAALFAMTGQRWIIHEWVHPKTFVQALTNEHYVKTEDSLLEGDVVTWENSAGVIQHASYYIGNQLFFNKNGQTFFNPWKIVDFADLDEQWHHFQMNIYRQQTKK